MTSPNPEFETLALTVNDIPLQLSTIHRRGPSPAILFLHGFGSCKEDLYDLVYSPSLKDHSFIAYDAPGCGATTSDAPNQATIQFQVCTARAVLHHYNIPNFYVIGHSTGALTALMLASELPPAHILGFINIEGNLAPEDCFFSRELSKHATSPPAAQLDCLVDLARSTPGHSNALYASLLPARVHPAAIQPMAKSTLDLSWKNLLGRFVRLKCPLMFMFGELNQSLSYMDQLEKNGVELARIPRCGHFPMYSNPAKMYRRIEGFLSDHSAVLD